jgi:hypothetical protein
MEVKFGCYSNGMAREFPTQVTYPKCANTKSSDSVKVMVPVKHRARNK